MTDVELLNHAEMKLDEAIRSGNAHEREFWRGYVNGLKVKSSPRHALEDLVRAMKEDGR